MRRPPREEPFGRNDLAAYSRLTSLPIVDALVLDVNRGAVTTRYDVARFARQVIPDVVVYVNGEAKPSSFNAFGVPHSEFIEKPFTPDELAAIVVRKLCTCH